MRLRTASTDCRGTRPIDRRVRRGHCGVPRREHGLGRIVALFVGRQPYRPCACVRLASHSDGRAHDDRRHLPLLSDAGQGTVEAAFVLPVLLVALMLLVQPAIILYDRMVMESAAAEGCRLLATKTDAYGDTDGACEAFVRHRLAAIPPIDCFHVHEGGCSWDIEMNGGEKSRETTVRIANRVKPLPFFDAAVHALGAAGPDGTLEIEVKRSAPVQPDWIAHAKGGKNPKSWIGAW